VRCVTGPVVSDSDEAQLYVGALLAIMVAPPDCLWNLRARLSLTNGSINHAASTHAVARARLQLAASHLGEGAS
jgi:hypothetical protein